MKIREIEDKLDIIGIPLNLTGYEYLARAILIYNRNPFLKMPELYKIVAQELKLNIHHSKVERAIRFIHEYHEKEIKKYFNINYKLTNMILIQLIERDIKRNQEQEDKDNTYIENDEQDVFKLINNND